MGKFSSSAQGEIDAYKIGLSSDIKLYDHLKENIKQLSEKHNAEYLIGYGAGFYRGREFRIKIIEYRVVQNNSKYSLQQDIDSILYLYNKQGLYLRFFQQEKNIIAHISNWHETKLPSTLTKLCLELLTEEKLTTTITTISNHYETHYNLHGFIWARKQLDQVAALNKKKREKKYSPEDDLKKKEIAETVKSWIRNNRQN